LALLYTTPIISVTINKTETFSYPICVQRSPVFGTDLNVSIGIILVGKNRHYFIIAGRDPCQF